MYIPDINKVPNHVFTCENFMMRTTGAAGKIKKAVIFNHYLYQLIDLAKSVINWVNMPKEIPEIVVEEKLLFHAKSVFFVDDVTGVPVILPCVPDSTLNKYGVPKTVTAYGLDGFNYTVDIEGNKGVIIYDNYNMRPIINDLMQFAERMADTLITTDVNLKQQRNPLIYRTTQQGKSTIDRLMQSADGGAYSCAVDRSLDRDIAELLYTPVPYIADKLQMQLEKIWAEALTFIGIVNVDEKAERLNSFEVGSQIEDVVSMLNTRLKPRREACKRINELFGYDMDVVPASWILTRDRTETIRPEASQDESDSEGEEIPTESEVLEDGYVERVVQ